MTYEPPEHARLYVDVMRVLPIPGDVMTFETHQTITELLSNDVDDRKHKPQPDNAVKPEAEEKAKEDERPKLTAGSHLADSSKAGWTPQPDTYVFGFNRRRT